MGISDIFSDPIGTIGSWASDVGRQVGTVNHTALDADKDYVNQMLTNERLGRGMVGPDPYAEQVNANLARMNGLANGTGPSLAKMQYGDAFQNQLAGQRALAAGGRGAGRALAAGQNMSRAGAGYAGGLAQAQLGERMANQNAYTSALSGAQGADFQRNQLSSQVQLDLLAKRLGVTRATMEVIMANSNKPTAFEKVLNTTGSIMPLAGMGGGNGGGQGGGGSTFSNNFGNTGYQSMVGSGSGNAQAPMMPGNSYQNPYANNYARQQMLTAY